MLDINSFDEIEFIKPKKISDIKKFTCSGKELEAILFIKDEAESENVFKFLDKFFEDPLSVLVNLEYLNLIEVSVLKKQSTNLKTRSDNLNAGNKVKLDVKEILYFIEFKLLEAIGPIANVIFDDSIDDMGEFKKTFSEKRIPELINILSKEIPREDKKKEFQKAMMNKLKELKIA